MPAAGGEISSSWALVLVPLLPLDLHTWKGERGPVHLRAGPNPWVCFTRFTSGLTVYRACVCCLLETYRLLGLPGLSAPAEQGVLALRRTCWLTGELPGSRPGPSLQVSCPISPRRSVPSLPTGLLSCTLVPVKGDSTLFLSTQMSVA